MKFCLRLLLVFLVGFFTPTFAQEKTPPLKPASNKAVKVKPSKVNSAKGREREKLFTDWLPQNDLVKLNDDKEKNNEQMIYFEYHEGKRKFRAIHSKAIKLRGWWWNTLYGEKEMEEEVNLYRSRGFEPAFVVLERNFYQILFVKPDQLAETQKLLKDIGIEPPTLK
jgi:hypothetical protein